MAEVYGRVVGVQFNEGTYYVFSMDLDEVKPPRSLVGSNRMIKVRGHLVGVLQLWQGAPLRLVGDWVNHPKYGWQFQFRSWQPWARDERGISIFLSQCVEGFLNAEFVNALIAAHGKDVYEVLTNEPDKVRAIATSPELAERVDLSETVEQALVSWTAINVTYALSTLLEDLQVTPDMLKGVLAEFGVDAAKVVQENPYALLRVDGFEFRKVDALAFQRGHSQSNEARVEGAVLWVLRDAASSGHLCVRRGDLETSLQELVRDKDVAPFVSPNGQSVGDAIMAAVDRLTATKAVVIDPEAGVYLWKHYFFERKSAEKVAAFMGSVNLQVDVTAFLEEWQANNKVTLSDAQREAVHKLVSHKVLVLTGLPGTGKTTVVKAFVALFKKAGINMLLLAPTGIAAKRMAGVTGNDASTIHRAFRYDTKTWGFDSKCQYVTGAAIVDETSMVDQELFFRILDALRTDTILVLVGDDAQLPSVGPGNVLHELVGCPVIPCVRLTQIFRQSERSAIVVNSHKINRGETFPLRDTPVDSDFRFVEVGTDEQVADLIVQFAVKLKARNANFQVLSPKYDGIVGVDNLNQRIREALNPYEGQHEAKIGPLHVRVGDRVMITQNNYKLNVYNGDMGKLVGVQPKDLSVRVFGAGGRGVDAVVPIPKDQASMMLKLAYAVTVHKCVDPDTLVETPMGLIRASRLVGLGCGFVATPAGRAAFEKPVQNEAGPMLEVDTKDGYRLRVTPQHGLDIWDAEKGYVRKAAHAVRPGDFVRLRLGSEFPDSQGVAVPGAPLGQDVRARVYPLPVGLDSDLAEFLGMFVADGTLYQKGFRLAKRHEAYADRFATLCHGLFGVTPKRFFTSGAHHVEVSSTYIAAWLNSFEGLQPHAKRVPEQILGASTQLQAAFLRGLFEDGSVHCLGDKLDHLEFSTKFDDIARAVKVMLLRQGIVSGLLRRRNLHSVYVYGANAERFASAIGLISTAKVQRLSCKAGNETRYLVPILRRELLEIAEANGGRARFFTHTEKNAFARGTLSRHVLRQMLDRGTNHTESWEGLQDRLRFHHSKVRKVTPYLGPSVCVEVPEGHQFIQDGFSGWNSQGCEFDTVILPVTRSQGRMLQRNLLYTAVTRARQKVWLLGSEAAVHKAILNNQVTFRNTSFGRAIVEAVGVHKAVSSQEAPADKVAEKPVEAPAPEAPVEKPSQGVDDSTLQELLSNIVGS